MRAWPTASKKTAEKVQNAHGARHIISQLTTFPLIFIKTNFLWGVIALVLSLGTSRERISTFTVFRAKWIIFSMKCVPMRRPHIAFLTDGLISALLARRALAKLENTACRRFRHRSRPQDTAVGPNVGCLPDICAHAQPLWKRLLRQRSSCRFRRQFLCNTQYAFRIRCARSSDFQRACSLPTGFRSV